MEYMRFDNFLGAIISKVINKAVQEKVGMKPGVTISDLVMRSTTGERPDDTMELTITCTMPKENFQKLIDEVTK